MWTLIRVVFSGLWGAGCILYFGLALGFCVLGGYIERRRGEGPASTGPQN